MKKKIAEVKLIDNKDSFLYLVRRPAFAKCVLIFDNIAAIPRKMSWFLHTQIYLGFIVLKLRNMKMHDW